MSLVCNCALPAMRGPEVCYSCSNYIQYMNQSRQWSSGSIGTYTYDPNVWKQRGCDNEEWKELIDMWFDKLNVEIAPITFDPPV